MQTFQAVADPTRRRILDLLRRQELEAGAIAARFDVSRPAISRHLRVLREAGLVTARRSSRRRIYRLRAARLKPIDRWLEKYRAFWADSLDRLERHLKEPRDDG